MIINESGINSAQTDFTMKYMYIFQIKELNFANERN